MKQSAILSALGSAAFAAAHGIVSDIKFGSTWVQSYNPFQDQYMNPVPQRITWAFPSAGNGPVEDVASKDIVCNKGATTAPISQAVAAGTQLTFFWTVWPESHKGPVMTYLANCNGECEKVQDPSTLSYFKIDHAGLLADGTWASDKVIASNNSWPVTIPSDIAAGNYILRHELLALHSAGNANGAQFYPMCANLKITGGGSAKPAGVKFPGAYKATDPGILFNLYNNPNSYTIPGPTVYTSGGATSPNPQPEPQPEPEPEPSAEPTTQPEPTPEPTTQPEPTPEPSPEPSASPEPEPEPQPEPEPEPEPTPQPSASAAPTTTTGPAPTQTSKPNPSVDMNKCLDAVNDCIRKCQSKTGGDVSAKIKKCEAARAACYGGGRRARRAIRKVVRHINAHRM